MVYTSIDELNTFSFRDCEVVKYEEMNNRIAFDLEALIVLENNTQNTNFTKSYAGPANMEIINGSIAGATRIGFKRYNADNVLIEQEEDVILDEKDTRELIASFKVKDVVYLCSVVEKADSSGYLLELEIPDNDKIAPDMYELTVKGDSVRISWDKYMSRVQD